MNAQLNFLGGNSSRRTFLKTTAGTAAFTAFQAVSASRILGANDRLNVGVIGTGGRGNSHLRAVDSVKNESNVQLVAVCDTYKPRLMNAKEQFNLEHAFMDHRELLALPDLDVVTIATPDHVHGYQAIDAIKAKKDVYCEKPVTHWRQFELTKQLAQTVAESDQVFQLGTQGMSDGAWWLMKKLVNDGWIGQPIHAECGYFRVGDWGERGMPIDDPNAKAGPELDWDAFLADSPKVPFDVSRYFRWRMYEDYAGGPVTDLYPHTITPVLSILGVKFPREVVATGGKFRYQEREIPDTFNMMIDYPENITVCVMGTQGNDYPGTEGRGSGSRVPVVRGWDGTLTVKGNDVVFVPTSTGKEANKTEKSFSIDQAEDFNRFWTSFFTCCRKRDKNTLSPMDLAFYVQTALQMGMHAFRLGKAARFNPQTIEMIL